jgi:hypothetical protein
VQTISTKTIILIALFAVAYLTLILRKTARSQLDLYDLAMLSAVAVVPLMFATFPGFSDFVARLTGVAFPFVVLFGVLLGIVFLFIHRLTVRLHILENDRRLLVQELSLLRQAVDPTSAPQKRQST